MGHMIKSDGLHPLLGELFVFHGCIQKIRHQDRIWLTAFHAWHVRKFFNFLLAFLAVAAGTIKRAGIFFGFRNALVAVDTVCMRGISV